VCHNDPSPCNHVFRGGVPVALIDFDHAAPGRRLRDVAYAGWLWAVSADVDGPPITEQARRLRLIADAYGLRSPVGVVDAVMWRQQENLAEAVGRTASGDAAVADYARASAAWQREQLAWLREHAGEFRAIAETCGRGRRAVSRRPAARAPGCARRRGRPPAAGAGGERSEPPLRSVRRAVKPGQASRPTSPPELARRLA
jgi:aminoglycoside phosphotransferase (APT) family kinase protein